MEQSDGVTSDDLRNECERYLASPAAYDVDEDYLLDLIEYALDQSDYVSAWLLTGAALTRFPHNRYVWLHLAFILYEEGHADYALTVLKRFGGTDYWAESLIILIDSTQNPERVKPGLRRLIVQTERFQEDTLANILSVGRDTDNYELFCELLPELERKTVAQDLLWREMASWAELKQDSSHQLEWIEKYIDSCPYDAEAWEMRARYYLYVEPDADEAMSAAEYALAIDPKSMIGQLARIEAASMKSAPGEASEKDIARMNAWFMKAIESMNDPAACLEQYVNFVRLYNLQDRPEIQQYLYDINKRYPDNLPVLDLLLRQAEANGEWEIQDFIIEELLNTTSPSASDEIIWVNWAKRLRAESLFHAAFKVLRTYYASSSVSYEDASDKNEILEMLYLDMRYDAIMAIDTPGADDDAFVITLFHKILVMARTGMLTELRHSVALLMTVVMGHSSGRSMPELMSGLSIGQFCLRLLEWADSDDHDSDGLNHIDPYFPILKSLYGAEGLH